MIKKLLTLSFCVVIALSGTYAACAQDVIAEEENVTNDEESIKVYTLSLDDAIKMALERSPELMSADVTIADAERQLVRAKRDQKDMEGLAIKASQGVTSFALQRGYYVKQAEIGVESSKMAKTQKIATKSYNVTEMYYNVKLLERILSSTEDAYELAKKNLDTVDTQFALGLVSQIDLNNAKYAVNQIKTTRVANERNLDLARKTLAATLFIGEKNYEMVLTDDIDYSIFSTDVNSDKENAMKSRYDVYMLDSACSQAEFMADIADLYGGTSSEYSSANQAKVQSMANRDMNKVLIGISIESAYNNILSAEDSLVLAQENLELKKQSYSAAEVQYGLGMITNSQLTSAMNEIVSAEIELENAMLKYKLAVEKYSYEITIGLGM